MTTPLVRRTALAAPRIIGTLVIVALISACSASPSSGTDAAGTVAVPVADGSTYTDVTAAGLNAMLAAKDFVLVNVHVPYEGEIESTDLSIPYDEIGGRLGDLPSDKAAKIVLYCRSGSMSAIAARELVTAGYTNIWNLDGGMNAWQAQGYPLVTN